MSGFDPSAAAPPGSGVFGLPHSEDEARVVLVPVPFEATTSYGGGAANGPQAVLDASRQVDLYDVETGRPYEAGIHMLDIPGHIADLDERAADDAERVVEAGGVPPGDTELAECARRVDKACERMNAWVSEQTARLVARGKLVGTVGGDHSTPFGAIAAHAEAYPGMGVLHLDAHADLRRAFEGFTWSHASIMYNVAERVAGVSKIVQVGIRDVSDEEISYIERSKGRLVTHFDAQLAQARFEGETFGDQVRRIVSGLPRDVYLSFDIDGLDPTLCPHTGTPVPGGLSFNQACALVAGVVRAGKRIVGLDLNEVAPGDDGDEWDGNVGARLLYKMIGWMLKSRSYAPESRS